MNPDSAETTYRNGEVSGAHAKVGASNSASVSPELISACENWKAWTIREGEALQGGEWGAVREYQAQKSKLQPLIASLISSDAPPCRELRALVLQLTDLEEKNLATLAAKRSALVERQQQLERASAQLHQMRRSYGTAQIAANWTSYC